ncbi:hypothetical protein AB4Y96_16405 [Phyllobacterium sp. TAF24]|uniref:hypothetical protein n=1 Tax=Phyllobacterium sp. TAF24 TaxID=3233068 RepID=UPI003F96A67F
MIHQNKAASTITTLNIKTWIMPEMQLQSAMTMAVGEGKSSLADRAPSDQLFTRKDSCLLRSSQKILCIDNRAVRLVDMGNMGVGASCHVKVSHPVKHTVTGRTDTRNDDPKVPTFIRKGAEI